MEDPPNREEGSGGPVVFISLLGEADWRTFRVLRIRALQESPASFASSLAVETEYGEDQWRELLKRSAVFVAIALSQPVGLVAGIPRDPPGVGEVLQTLKHRPATMSPSLY